MDFSVSPRAAELVEAVRAFIRDEAPVEHELEQRRAARSSTSALPGSGALQLNTEGARNDQPVASAIAPTPTWRRR
jgi:hypothetical protein